MNILTDFPVRLAGRLHGLQGLDRSQELQRIRTELIEAACTGDVDTDTLLKVADTVLWIDRVRKLAVV